MAIERWRPMGGLTRRNEPFRAFDDLVSRMFDDWMSPRLTGEARGWSPAVDMVDKKDEIVVRGSLGWAKQERMTTGKLVVLRLLMLAVGRFFPNLVRRLLQRRLITGKRDAPFSFERRLHWGEQGWRVTDVVRAADWSRVESVGVGGHQTSIYVAMSRTFQVGQLAPWIDLTARVARLRRGEALVLEREL